MKLESGAPRSSKTYWVIVIVVLLAVSGLFLRDWGGGYARKNLDTARKRLGLSDDQPLELTAAFTEADFRKLRDTKPTQLAQLTEVLGRPFRSEPAADHSRSVTYVGQYGMVTVGARRNRITSLDWHEWKYKRAQIEAQLYWACGVLLLAPFAVYKVVKAMSLRVTLDDEGMSYGGLRINYADMTAFTGLSPKGWVDLNYSAGGGARKLRLDNQRVDQYNEIILAICEKTELENPLRDDIADDDDVEESESADDAS